MKINIRDFNEKDKKEVQEIFSMYWTDPEFLDELSGELDQYVKKEHYEGGFIVLESNDEIVGIAGYKKIPDYLKKFAQTKNPVELYVIAVKYKRRGFGKQLKFKLIETATKAGFSEILLFSPESHNESWSFHDIFNFKRIGEVTPPEDKKGHVWSKEL